MNLLYVFGVNTPFEPEFLCVRPTPAVLEGNHRDCDRPWGMATHRINQSIVITEFKQRPCLL